MKISLDLVTKIPSISGSDSISFKPSERPIPKVEVERASPSIDFEETMVTEAKLLS